MTKEAPPGTQSVLRAIALLKALAATAGESDLGELTETVGLSRTTTHRLLSALESEELVSRNGATNAYRLGPAAIALGTQALRSSDVRDAAQPFLAALAAKTGETATLEVLSGGRMLIIDEALGRHLVGTTQSIGTTWPVHATSTGKTMLAALPEPQRQQILAGELKAFTERTLVRGVDLEADLERTRRRGFALSWKELAVDFGAVSSLVRGAMGTPRAAISIGAPAARVRKSELLEMGRLVARAALDTSVALGYRGT